jgi:hypothetical protein
MESFRQRLRLNQASKTRSHSGDGTTSATFSTVRHFETLMCMIQSIMEARMNSNPMHRLNPPTCSSCGSEGGSHYCGECDDVIDKDQCENNCGLCTSCREKGTL